MKVVMTKGLLFSALAFLLFSLSFSSFSQTSDVVYCVPAGPRVALTFDDGPWRSYTPEVLAILKEKGVLATFFTVGQRIRIAPDILLLVHQAGHEIGLHTDDHKSLLHLTLQDQNAEIQRNYQAVQEIIPGLPIHFWRAPYGAIPKPLPSIVKDLGLKHQGWSVDSEDWRKPGEEKFLANVLLHVKDGGVILMHEHTQDARHFLPKIIDTLQSQGYQFVILSDLHAPTCPTGKPPLLDPPHPIDSEPSNLNILEGPSEEFSAPISSENH